MGFAEKLWKKSKLAGKEAQNTQVVEKIGEIAKQAKELKPQEVAKSTQQDVVKSTLNGRKVARVLAWLEKYNVKETEIEKLTDAEIETICDGLRTAPQSNWGNNYCDSFILNKKKVATWGEYDLYFAKTANIRYKNRSYHNVENELCLSNFVFVTNKDGLVKGALYQKDKNFDISKYDALVIAFYNRSEWDKEKINGIAFFNAGLSYDKIKYAEHKLITKTGKVLPLSYAFSQAGNRHYMFNTLCLKKDDKIIKNSVQEISRDYEILPNGEMTPLNNWQLTDKHNFVEGELLGMKKQNGENVVDKSKYCEDFKGKFDANKNYGDISLYAEKNENGEFEIQANDDDREGEWQWKKVAVSPKFNQPVLQITVFDKVRKQEIINSKAEVEEVHFFDANNFELAGNFKFDKTKTKFENEQDIEHGEWCC